MVPMCQMNALGVRDQFYSEIIAGEQQVDEDIDEPRVATAG